ncbi:hypothetical protein [Terrabacter sp. Soil810]|uniref:TY-Chap domain-containing protein n=1 Tax=Terrabacter sp. Soil810 TaxID=1736418 RepID=UPI00070A980D|nr:hypothetical protein [Terrabacter sp. Soil810]KRF35762.1 hypothetical protein ASG96_20450 [Terrabacter sp. Soil810]
MSEGPLEESWESWTTRIAADLAALTEDDWLTFTVHVSSQAASTYAAERAPRGRRRGGARPARPARVPDVFVQARRLEGVLALECIGDTQFEGLTDLTSDQQAALADLGWEREGDEPEFSRALDSAAEAAGLLRASLAGVLGAATPADVDIRRAERP